MLETWEVILLIILVLGVVVSNLMVLKYSSKFKMPQFGAPKKSSKKPKAPLKKTPTNNNEPDK